MGSDVKMVRKSNILEYFQPFVHKALKQECPQASENTEYYLARLLADFAQSQVLFEGMGTNDPPLAIQLGEALQAPTGRRMALLKRVGDYTLYMSGFFTRGLNLRLVDVNYYKNLGRSAYHYLASTRTPGEMTITDIFNELSDGFDSYVSVLGAVRDISTQPSQKELAFLYRSWFKDGKPETAARLRRMNLAVPTRGPRN